MTLSCRIRVLKALKSLSLSQSLSLSKFPLITLLLITNSIATPPANAPEEHSHHSHQIVIRSRQPHLYCTVLYCNLYSSPLALTLSVCLSVAASRDHRIFPPPPPLQIRPTDTTQRTSCVRACLHTDHHRPLTNSASSSSSRTECQPA